MASKQFKIFFAVILFSFLIFLLILVLYFATEKEKTFDYGLVIDVGSSSTKFFLYNWPSYKVTNGLVQQIETCKTYFSLGYNLNDTNRAINGTLNCFKKVVKKIPKKIKGPFPLFVGATAGIRILELTDPMMAHFILKNISEAFLSLNFSNHFFRIAIVKVLSGEEEGLNAWIGANYLKSLIPSKVYCLYPQMPKDTVGILDMGGASTQIAYSTNYYPNHLIQLFHQVYSSRSESILCFGSDQAVKRYIYMLIMQQNKNDDQQLIINDPCSFDDPDRIITSDKLIDNVCLKTLHQQTLKRGVNYTIRGNIGNYSQCFQIVRSIIDPELCSKTFYYCFWFNGVIENNTAFYAFASYHFTINFLDTFNDSKATQIEESIFLKETESWCHKNWSLKLENQQNKKHLKNSCFKLHYIYVMLKYGYKFKDLSKIYFVNQINDQNLAWALGYMLSKTNFLPSTKHTSFISLETLFGSLLCLVLITIVCVCITFKNKGKTLSIEINSCV